METKDKKDLEEEIRKALAIDETSLKEELKSQPSKHFHFGTLWAKALKAERAQRLAVEVCEAELSKEFRQEMAKISPSERITEKMVREYVSNHPTYKAEQEKLIMLGAYADILGVAKVAFESRAKILLELARQQAVDMFYEAELKKMREEFELNAEKRRRKKHDLAEEIKDEIKNDMQE